MIFIVMFYILMVGGYKGGAELKPLSVPIVSMLSNWVLGVHLTVCLLARMLALSLTVYQQPKEASYELVHIRICVGFLMPAVRACCIKALLIT